MSVSETTAWNTVTPPWPVRRFSVAEYRQLGECGVLTPEDRGELLEGWIVPKMNQRPAHRFAVGLLNEWIQRSLPSGFFGLCQLLITTATSEPEPDLAIVCGNHGDFRSDHPTGADCRLVIEVADTSVERDRQKAAIYAAAGITEYWILNLVQSQLEQYTQVGDGRYDTPAIRHANEIVALDVGDATLQLDLSKLLAT